MKQLFLLFTFLTLTAPFLLAQTPTLGIYSSVNIPATGSDTSLVPSIAPGNVLYATATTTSNFKGQLNIDPSTGVVRIVNAHPAGTYPVTIRGFNVGNVVSASFTLTINTNGCGSGQFGSSSNALGSTANAVAIADFNKDGRQDLAFSMSTGSAVAIRLGNGNGGFTGTGLVQVGSASRSVAVADFNGDGNTDLASAGIDNTVSIRLGNGTGGFSGSTEVPIGAGVRWIAVADFNQDGQADFVTANSNSNTISVRLGDGNGSFNGNTNLNTGNTPNAIAIADFNGDTIPDIATVNVVSNNASIYLGNGTGLFPTTSTIAVGTNPTGIVSGDFNNDGRPDLAITNGNVPSISIRLGNGNGGFTVAPEQAVGFLPQCIAIADFNGDGNQDLVSANQGGLSGSLTVRFGDGTGGFYSFATITTSSAPSFVAVGDFNKDGRQDLVTSNSSGNNFSTYPALNREIDVVGNGVSIAAGSTTPNLANHTDFGNTEDTVSRIFTIRNAGNAALNIGGIYISGADSAMYAFEGIADQAVIASGGVIPIRVIFRPQSAGLKTARINIYSDDCDESLYTFTIQGTGTTAPVTIGNYPDTVTVTTSGSANVSATAAPFYSVGFTAFAPASLKGSIVVNNSTGSVSIVNAHPAGAYLIKLKAWRGFTIAADSFILIVANPQCSQAQFVTGASVTASGEVYALAVSDFNTDGKQDLIIASRITNKVYLRLGNGTTGFTGTTDVAVGKDPANIAVADFNGDGNADFVTANSGDSTVSLCLGNGAGIFSRTNFSIGAAPYGLVVNDFNNDGKLDFITSNNIRNTFSTRLGDGKGGFTAKLDRSINTQAQYLASGDFNNDGNQDLAVGGTGLVTIFPGNGKGDFTEAALLNNNQNPNGLLATDINKDGKLDIVTTDGLSKVHVWLGNGNGSFAAPLSYIAGTNPSLLTTGDYNGDGNPDLAVLNRIRNESGTADIGVLLGNGMGNFTATTSLPGVGAPRAIITGDVNNDQRQELIVADPASSVTLRMNTLTEIDVTGNNVSIASGDTVSSLADHTDFGSTSGSIIRSFTIENTSSVKLTVSNISLTGADSALFTTENITLPVNVEAGLSITFRVNFVPRSAGVKKATLKIVNDDCDESIYNFAIQGTGVVRITPGTYPASVAVNNGGNISVVPITSPSGAGTITAYTSSAFKGKLRVNPTTGVVSIINAQPAGTYTITVGDPIAFRTFLLTVGNGNCSGGRFQDSSAVVFPRNVGAVAIGDLNNDGRQDLVVSQLYPSDTIYTLLNNGTGTFTVGSKYRVNGAPYLYTIVTADFNGDGNLDFAMESQNILYVCRGDGAGGVSSRTTYGIGGGGISLHTLAVGDFNNDGRPDIVAADGGSASMYTCMNDGTGLFTVSRTVIFPATSGGSNPNTRLASIAVADIDGDGKEDVLVSSAGAALKVMKGDGTGSFKPQSVGYINVGSVPLGIVAGDFNQDTKPDVAVVGSQSSSTTILLNNGGSLPPFGSSYLSVQDTPQGIAAGDVNGDGIQDLVVSNTFSNSVSVRWGYPNGTFYGNLNVPVTASPLDVVLGDFNQDGKLDMAVPGSNKLTLRLSRSSQINVQGNGRNIPIGSTTTDTANFTHLGNVLNGDSVTRHYVLQNTGTDTLRVIDLYITGADSSLFIQTGNFFPAVLPPGASTNFTVRFKATGNGLKKATFGIISDDCDEPYYTFSVSAKVICPASADNIWLGISAEWNDPFNWSLGVMPGDCSRVVVNTGVPFMPQISTNAGCYSLTLNNGATFTVIGTGHLTITGP